METITLTEAATRLGISTKTARRWVKTGRLVATLAPGEHGPEYRVAVEALTAAQVVDPTPPRAAGVTTTDQAALLRALDTLPTLLSTLDSMASDLREARREIAELREQVAALAPPVAAPPEPAPAPAETHTEQTHTPASTQPMETQQTPARRPFWRRWFGGLVL